MICINLKMLIAFLEVKPMLLQYTRAYFVKGVTEMEGLRKDPVFKKIIKTRKQSIVED